MDASSATERTGNPDLSELDWLVRGRWVASMCLLAGAAYAAARKLLDSPWPLVAVAGLVGLYNLVLARAAWPSRLLQRVVLASLILDLLALTACLHFSGDMENPLFFAYSVPVVAAAVFLSRQAGFVLTACAILLFTALVLGTHLDSSPVRLPHHHLSLLKRVNLHEVFDPDQPNVNWDFILSDLVMLFAILFGSAYGFGTLSDRLRERNAVIRREHERLSVLLGILPEGIVLLGNDRSVILANRAARSLLAGIEKGFLGALDPRLRIEERLSRLDGPPEEFETRHGERVLCHALAWFSAGGPVVWVVRDVTRERLLMAQVIHRSKMADLGLLAAGIAHEIGNPLSSMSAIVELLEMDLKETQPEFAERLRALRRHVGRIAGIVQDIGSFARPSAGQRTWVRAGKLVEQALRIFYLHGKSREMQVEGPAQRGDVVLEVVEDQIVQVLLNLLLNAADASGGRGSIAIAVRETPRAVEISITDDGKGMDEEVLGRLYTPFFTTKEPGKGEGLGLFVSASIVRAHEGRIDVRSAPGQGSTFTVWLPRPE